MRHSPPKRHSDTAIRVALSCFFFVFGLSSAAWVVRIPDIRNLLSVSTSTLGILFLCSAIGAMLALLAAPKIIARLSTRFAITFGFTFIVSGASIAITALILQNPVLLGTGNFLSGIGFGIADVGVNVEGAELEKRVGRSLLPQLHGAFSVGTLVGALLGTLSISTGVSVVVQTLILTAVFIVVLILCLPIVPRGTGVRSPLPQALTKSQARTNSQLRTPRKTWLHPRILLLGLAIFGGSVAEGGANDWLALSLVDDYHIPASSAALTFAILVGAMSVVRLTGGRLADRLGRVATLRMFAVIGICGVCLIILGAPHPPLAWVGAAAWGAGVALVFPLTISAAADGEDSSGRVAVVTAFGYSAFLVAPPFLGLIAQQWGLLHMFWIFVALLVLLIIGSGATRPLPQSSSTPVD